MNKTFTALILIQFLFFSISYAQKDGLVIKNINYINVEEGSVKVGDVLLQNGIIKKIEKKIRVKSAYQEIDGTGKWLIPGLVDAHIHLFQSGGLYTRPDVVDLRSYKDYEEERSWLKENASDLLKRYLRCGITTVVDMGGPMYNFELRDKYKDPQLYPNLYLTGPLISTHQPAEFRIEEAPIIKAKTKEEAIALVQKQLPYKPDFIKIWYIAIQSKSVEDNFEIVKAAADESHKNGLKVAIHATELNTAKLAIKAGADILVHSVKKPIDEEFIEMLKQNNVVYVPTLIVMENYLDVFEQDINFSPEDYSISNPIALGSLMDSNHFPEGNPMEGLKEFVKNRKQKYAEEDSIQLSNLNLISKNPVIISTGTDAGNIGTAHASSYYAEIAKMKKAGLSNSQILAASTINGAKLLGKENELGSVDVNKLADLLILNSNPLDTINAIKDIAFVIKGGNLMSVDSILVETPENLVQKQLNGYNARNIEAFLEPFSEEVVLYGFPADTIAQGKQMLREIYGSMFLRFTDLHGEVLNRIVMGNTVIDHEMVTGVPKSEPIEAIAIYKIKNNKIVSVHFIEQ